MEGKQEYAGKFEKEKDAWEAVQKKKAEAGEVAKVNKLPQSKYPGVSWNQRNGTEHTAVHDDPPELLCLPSQIAT